MVETWGHYAKWKKLITKRQHIRFHLYEVLKVVKFIYRESETVVARGSEKRKMENYC